MIHRAFFNYLSPYCSLQRTEETPQPRSVDAIAADVIKRSGKIFASAGQYSLTKEIQELNSSKLYYLLDKLAEHVIKADDPEILISDLAPFLSLAQMEIMIKKDHPEYETIFTSIQALAKQAELFLEQLDRKPTLSWKVQTAGVVDVLISIIESLVNAFGLADFFTPPDSALDKQIKSGQISQLLMLFTTITALLIPSLGPALATAIVGGFFLGTTTLSLIFPYIRPTPSRLPKAVNWTKQYQKGQLIAPMGRKTKLYRIATALTSSEQVKTHPMLIGKSGVGKTETIKAFVEAVERGDYPKLQGKKVFYVNSAQLVQGAEVLSGENKILSHIDEALGRHRNNIILVFDEIHLVCQNKSAVSEKLKTMLDPSGAFPYVIGVTTEEEYSSYIQPQSGGAFARRFEKIDIDDPKPEEVLEILSTSFLRQAPHILIHKEVLPKLREQSQENFPSTPQPMSSLKILGKCLQRTAQFRQSAQIEKVEKIRTHIRTLLIEDCITQTIQHHSEIIKLEQQLQQEEAFLKAEYEKAEKFFRLRESFLAVRKKTYQEALELATSPNQSDRLAAFFFRFYILKEKYIKE
ncbi:MAG: AAA family ATPase, partial [Chlamydiales bacterium]|nr:AAA family ATPase [Chlamydiales bacterium]